MDNDWGVNQDPCRGIFKAMQVIATHKKNGLSYAAILLLSTMHKFLIKLRGSCTEIPTISTIKYTGGF